MDYALYHWRVIAVVFGVIILLACYRWVLALCGVIIVPDDSVVAGGGASGGTLVDVLLANVIREGTLRSVPKT
jgi:hypothetical protein